VTAIAADRRSILVIEDNAADAALVVDALGETPAAPVVRLARGGREALAWLRGRTDGEPPDIILLDLNLPGLSGLETLAELKADPVLRRIPVLVLTTSKSQDEINGCYERGAAAVLNKPLRLRDYRALVGALERFWLGHVRFAEAG